MGYQTIPAGTGWNDVPISANCTSFVIPLTGSSTADYLIKIQLNVANPGQLHFRPNSLGTNLVSTSWYSSGAALAVFGGAIGIFAGSGGSGTVSGTFVITGKTGQYREFVFTGHDYTFTAGIQANIQWQESTTEISSGLIIAQNANSILAGSLARWKVA